jgi:cytidylate kinase
MVTTAFTPSATPPAADRRPVRLVTLSREYGAGGSELGLRLADALGWPLLDRDLAHRIAERLHCADADAARLAECAPSWLDRIAQAFAVVPSDAPILPDPALRSPDPDDIVAATQEVLREAAQHPPLIVVGHGANILFGGRADLLRVRVCAPFEERVRRVAARTGVTAHEAAADVRHRDADRRHFLARYYRSEVTDATRYDLQINTAILSLEVAARIVLTAIEASAPAAPVTPVTDAPAPLA